MFRIYILQRIIKERVNLSLYLTKYHAMKTYPVFN